MNREPQSPPQWPALIWPAIIAASAIGTVLANLVEPVQPLRTVLAFWFLLVCPGMALVRLLRLSDPFAELAVAVALSLALDTAVGETLLFAGAWSAFSALAALATLSVGGAALQVAVLGPVKLNLVRAEGDSRVSKTLAERARLARLGPSAVRPRGVESRG